MTTKTNKTKETLDNIIKQFESGNIPEAIAIATFPTINIPSMNWSFLNRILMILSGTGDGRGFNQWKAVNRKVKKGAKAFYILVPCFYKNKNEEGEEENYALRGFKGAPMFRAEDTEGDQLEYEKLELPELPLIDKAKEWDISVKAVPMNGDYYGRYSLNRDTIEVATTDEGIFFHELAHAAHNRITKLNPGQHATQEVVAELAATVLCRLAGKSPENMGRNYQYIEHYSKKEGLSVSKMCLNVIKDTEQVINLIMS